MDKTNTSPIKVIVVNDNPMVIEGFERLINQSDGKYELTHCFYSTENARRFLDGLSNPSQEVNIIITEITFFKESPTYYELKSIGKNVTYASESGLDLVAFVRSYDQFKDIKIVIHTEHDRWAYIHKARICGVDGYIYENDFRDSNNDKFTGLQVKNYLTFLDNVLKKDYCNCSNGVDKKIAKRNKKNNTTNSPTVKEKEKDVMTAKELQLSEPLELSLTAIAKSAYLLLNTGNLSTKLEDLLEKKRIRNWIVNDVDKCHCVAKDKLLKDIVQINRIFGLDFQDKSPNILASVQEIINIAIDFDLIDIQELKKEIT